MLVYMYCSVQYVLQYVVVCSMYSMYLVCMQYVVYCMQYVVCSMQYLVCSMQYVVVCSMYMQYGVWSMYRSVQYLVCTVVSGMQYCSTVSAVLDINGCPLARGITKNFIRAGKFSRVVARSGNNELHRLLHLNSPPTLVVNMFKIKKYHNTIVAKIAMLEIRSFVDHKLAVFTYFKCNFSLCTSQRCDQKLSNLACSIKQRTGCENQAEQGRSSQQMSEVQRIKVQALVCDKQMKSEIFHICLLIVKHNFYSDCWKLHS